MLSDEQLSRLAEAALLKEAKRGAERAETAGPSGWLKPKVPPTNKLFLQNTIRGALASNEVKDQKSRQIKKTKLEMFEKQLKEKNRYKRVYLKASTKLKDKECSDSTAVKGERLPEGSSSKTEESSKLVNKRPLVNGIEWNEDGLEISYSFKKSKNDKRQYKVINNNLPRNIKFVSQSLDDDNTFSSNLKDDP